jgi:hypothetical protein
MQKHSLHYGLLSECNIKDLQRTEFFRVITQPTNCHHSLRNNPEEHGSQLLLGGSKEETTQGYAEYFDVSSIIDHLTHANSNLINPLNAELNLIRHLLALLGAHHILHVRRLRVKNTHSLETQTLCDSEPCRMFTEV